MDKRSPVNSSSWKSIQASANKTQLATDPEMCMFALTVSTAEPKNIKEAMADSAWIEAMQEELSSVLDFEESFATDARLVAVRILFRYAAHNRPDIVQAVCYCSMDIKQGRLKHTSKEVKRIFRYLSGTIHMGLWYPTGSGFELTAFSDVDHAGYVDTRKITSGGIQFLELNYNLADLLSLKPFRRERYSVISSVPNWYEMFVTRRTGVADKRICLITSS
ncbi:hypothetical protein Tco_0891205 [Tanacetum coccineum]|uniref:Gag-Pol polyprotein n=1 Tax=Tanacetum coccineum TaxID=301880 RepID=A0ABQ5C5H0_9ASTR